MADTVHFMLSCNGNYLCHAAVVLISVMEHASPKRFYHCHYFKDDVKDWQIRQFVSISRQYKNLEITVHEPQIDINYNGHYTRSACVRLNIDKELPELEKCLYLDADMLITDDIARLYDTDISGFTAAVAQDFILNHFVRNKLNAYLDTNENFNCYNWESYAREILKIVSPEKMFNAGMILFNIPEYRKHSIGKKAIDFINQYNPPLVDQDALNSFMDGKVKYVSERWNVNLALNLDIKDPLYSSYNAVRNNVGIWHGHFWDHLEENFPCKKAYLRCLKKSPFEKKEYALLIHGPFKEQWLKQIYKQIHKFNPGFKQIVLVSYSHDIQAYHEKLRKYPIQNIQIIAVDDPQNPGFCNINRQLICVKKGLDAIFSGAFVFKLRNDQCVDFNKVLKEADFYKINTTNCYSRADRLYHPSDMFLFASQKLLKDYYSMPLSEKNHDETVRQNIEICHKNPTLNYLPIAPESELCRHYLRLKNWFLLETKKDSLDALKKYFNIMNSWDINFRWKKKRNHIFSAGSIILPHYFSVAPFPGTPLEKARCLNHHQLENKKPSFKDIFYICISKTVWSFWKYNKSGFIPRIKKIIKNLAGQLFSIKNTHKGKEKYKVLTLAGIKIKKKLKKKATEKISNETVINILKSRHNVPLTSDGEFYYYRSLPVFSKDFNLYSDKCTFPKTAVILQGPIIEDNNFTLETLRIYKKIFNNPSCVIILSTWKGNNQQLLTQIRNTGIEVIESDIPKEKGRGNINLQSFSTLAGIEFARAAGCEFVLKTRTDQRFYAANILEFLFNIQKTFPLDAKVKEIRKRLIALSFNTFKFRIYGVSDMFLFGHIDDVYNFWNLPTDYFTPELFSGKEQLEIFQKHCPETVVVTSFLKNIGYTPLQTLEDTYKVYARYFCFIDKETVEMFWPKYSNANSRWEKFQVSPLEEMKFRDWLNLYYRTGINREYVNIQFKELPEF